MTITGFEKNKWGQSCFALSCSCGGASLIIRPEILRRIGFGCKKCSAGKVSTRDRRIHGKSTTRLYSIWKDMVNRCYNPKIWCFGHYGGRGITVCNEWKSDFLSFEEWALKNGYEEKLTIDRTDNNGNYEPTNCQWATMKTQRNNTRRNVYMEVEGVVKTRTQWAEETGIPYEVIRSRTRSGWSNERAVKTPH